MIRIVVLLLNFLFIQSVCASYLTNTEISKVNLNTIEYIKNFSIENTVSEINTQLNNNKFNECSMFESKNKNYLPKKYIQNRCLYNSVRSLSEKKGFLTALLQNGKTIEQSQTLYLYAFSDSDFPEEITSFYEWFYPNLDVPSTWLDSCKKLPYFNSKTFDDCIMPLYRIKDNIGFADHFRKYMEVCDYYYPGQDKRMSDVCMQRLSSKSVNPFERIQTACLLKNYTVINLNGIYVRKSKENEYYQCLSQWQDGNVYLYWQAQKGYEYGYALGLYILKNNLFSFIK